MSKSAIVIGASSGIGLEIARLLSRRGYRIGIAARREELLRQHAEAAPNVIAWKQLDLQEAGSVGAFHDLANALGTVDFVYLCSGVGFLNPDLEWRLEEETLSTNVTGFARLACAAMKKFAAQGSGHLVGLSSIAALRGAGEAPAYSASKAFVSRYLQGLHFKAKKSGLPIHVTDVRPGFVDTAMMKADKPFWVASPEKAATQIVDAAENRRRIVYVTKRWSLIGWLLRHLPE